MGTSARAPRISPEQALQEVQKIRAAGREDLLPRYFQQEGLNPADYQDANSPGGGLEAVAHAWGTGLRSSVNALEGTLRSPFQLMAGAGRAMGNYFIGPEAGAAIADNTPGAGPNKLADLLNLPTANNSFERAAAPVVEDAARAVPFALGGGALGMASAIASSVGAGMSQRFAEEHGVGIGGQAAAGLAVGLAIPAIMHGSAASIQRVMAGAAQQRQTAQQLQTILQQATGTDAVSFGQVAQGGIGRPLEKELRQSAGGSGAFRKTIAAQSEAMGNRVKDATKQLGGAASPERAGRAIQRGITEGFLPSFRSNSQQLYSQAEKLVPDATLSTPAATKALFDAQGGPYDATKYFTGLGHPYFQQWGDDLQNALVAHAAKGIPFGLLRDFRSRLGDIMSGRQAIEGLNQADLKLLYGALSDDMRTAVAATGGPAATTAWDRASKYWAAGMNRVENVLQPLLDKGVPEKAFTAMMSGTKDGATVLRSTMRSLNPAERQVVTATALSRLGKAAANAQDAAGEVFDPVRFVNQWATLAPEARAALFTGTNPQIVRDLNTLAKGAAVLKKSGQELGNPAQVASSGLWNAILTGIATGTAGTVFGGLETGAKLGGALIAGKAAMLGGSHQLAQRVFTNPKMIRWLTGTTALPLGAMYAQLTQLAKMSEQWNAEDRTLAKEFIGHFQGQDLAKMNVLRALTDATAVR